ncbi:MAG: hypothetical protein Q9227_000607 [Pyrenula ochraceoflavens]
MAGSCTATATLTCLGLKTRLNDSTTTRPTKIPKEEQRREAPKTSIISVSQRSQHSQPEAIHRRVECLKWISLLAARREEGSVSNGLTPPYCPKGPPAPPPEGNENLDLHHTRINYEHKPVQSSPLVISSQSVSGLTTMPHATSMPHTGFQALILCGPGVSLNTFTSVPAEYPKALIPIANRPMVWYVLDWCYRMGVSDITLITPPQSQPALSAALQQNPFLTSLPSPSPDLLTPPDLTFTTGTAELLRLDAVQEIIRSDFFLLPCDLVCDVGGETFLEAWMTHQGGLGGVTDGAEIDVPGPKLVGLGGERGKRRGGLSVWYSTTGREESVKREECDFNATAKLDNHAPASSIPVKGSDSSSLAGSVRKLVWASPMDSLREECEENKNQWQIRASFLKRYGNVKCLTQFRDAHIYLFPFWTKEFARLNEDFESVSEDLVGTWAKTDWRKPAYRARFGAQKLRAAY